MTKGKLQATKKAFAVFMSAALTVSFFGPMGGVYASEPDPTDPIANAYSDEGYHLVWNDEFSDDELNTANWNVETHDPGWVNNELQTYTDLDAGNIQVNDGKLKIYPKAKNKKQGSVVDVLGGKGFDGWTGDDSQNATATISEGKATVVINAAGSNAWDAQFQKAGLTLTEGHEYRLSMKAKAGTDRKVQLNITNTANYASIADKTFTVGTDSTDLVLDFTMKACDPGNAAAQINLGNFGDGEADSALTTIEFSQVTLIDLSGCGSGATALSGFYGWKGNARVSVTPGTDGAATVVIESVGDNKWDAQFQKAGLTLINGHKYKASFKAKAETPRMIAINLCETKNYGTFDGGKEIEIGTTDTLCETVFTMGEADEGKAALQINLGNFGDGDSALTTIEFSDLVLEDLDAEPEEETDEFNLSDYSFTSGRVNTQNKQDFTYGRFEAKIKVPAGKGYLPAFWLMATDEQNYGQWPLCGEMDIMEVLGNELETSYHTIHYGDPEHSESQGKKTLTDGTTFADDFHVYSFDWEPGLLVWYVDGDEVYRTSEWASGRDEESTLTYPAPFDQDFYVILNLAVGGDWPKDPDQAAVEDMENQKLEVDYVRVYQKNAAEYKEMEDTVKKPETTVVRKTPDAEGNYITNGDFSKELKSEDSDEDNFTLHLEKENEGTTATVSNNELTVTPVGESLYLHSVQVKQNGIPMVRGWNYTFSYDAYADVDDGATKQITADVKGPNRGWAVYYASEDQLTNEWQTFTHTFTYEAKTDETAVVEFNMGAQGADVPVHISNVKLIASGEEVEVPSKTVRADGNYVYNGTFDQGEGRLGYWEVDTNENDESEVIVTNEIVENGRQRELQAKIVVPDRATELDPVVVKQEDIAPILQGSYFFSFDAYKVDGDEGETDGMKAIVAGRKFMPELSDQKQSFKYTVLYDEDNSREESDVFFIFYKPGTYYLDNVKLVETELLKNGSFDSGKACYQTGNYEEGKAKFTIVPEVDDHKQVMDVDIEDIGKQDWNVQMKQSGITLEQGKKYRLTFDAKASANRVVSVSMQRDGSADNKWVTYSSGTGKYDLTSAWNTYGCEFVMESETDDNALFSVALGYLGEEVSAHHVYFDNIRLVELDAEGKEVDILDVSPVSPVDETGETYEMPADEKADVEAANDVKELFDLIPSADKITLEDQSTVEAAREAYDKLSDDQKAKFKPETLEILEKAEAKIAAAKQAKDDKDAEAASDVEDVIKALPDASNITTAYKAAIEAARKAYNGLSADQKAKVDATVLSKLTAAEKALQDAQKKEEEKKASDKAKDDKIATDKAAAKAFTDAIAKVPPKDKVVLSDEAMIKAARNAYSKLTADQKKYVSKADLNKLTEAEEGLTIAYDKEAARKVTQKINKLPAAKNIKTTHKKKITAVNKAYKALTKAQKGYVTKTTKNRLKKAKQALKVATDKAAAKKVTQKINKLPAAKKITTSNSKSIAAVTKAYKSLTTAQKKYVSATTKKRLKTAKNALKDATDEAAAKKVMRKIFKLPVAKKVKASNQKAIQAAREAYSALTKAQKEYVTQAAKKRLRAAEKALKALK